MYDKSIHNKFMEALSLNRLMFR